MPFDGFVENTEVTERLVIGRARIEAGWCQGSLHRYTRYTPTTWLETTWLGRGSEYCLLGAVTSDVEKQIRVNDDPAFPQAFRLITAALAQLGYDSMQITEFNDHPRRTKAEVLEVIDLAIAMSRGRAFTAF
jgi:hypothetical protein